MKIEMSLISKGINIKKVCNSEREAFIFQRDMPAKHGLLFSGNPYVIGKTYLPLITKK